MNNNTKKAVILLSGGLDSATVLAQARADGYECYALSFDYGQRHRCELQAAHRVAEAMGVKEHRIFDLNLRQFGGSDLTDDEISVPDAATATTGDGGEEEENCPHAAESRSPAFRFKVGMYGTEADRHRYYCPADQDRCANRDPPHWPSDIEQVIGGDHHQ